MKLYHIIDPDPDFEEVYSAYVVAQDEKHAERRARIQCWQRTVDFPNRIKKKLIVREVVMSKELIVGVDIWYGKSGCPKEYEDIYKDFIDKR